MGHPQPPPGDDDPLIDRAITRYGSRYLTVKQAAEQLNVSERFIQDLVAKGDLRAKKFGTAHRGRGAAMRIFAETLLAFEEQAPEVTGT